MAALLALPRSHQRRPQIAHTLGIIVIITTVTAVKVGICVVLWTVLRRRALGAEAFLGP